LRPPSVSQGVQAGLWAIFFGLFIALGAQSVDVAPAPAWIIGGLSTGAIFLFVRLRGAEDLRGPR
jgi:amino acid transporter